MLLRLATSPRRTGFDIGSSMIVRLKLSLEASVPSVTVTSIV